jgi:hypothetical protein
MISRRAFMIGTLASLPAYALLAQLSRMPQASAAPLPLARWFVRQQDIATALSHGEMRPVEWQMEVEWLARSVDFEALRAEVLRAAGDPVAGGLTNDPVKHVVRFKDEDGQSRHFAFGSALFSFSHDNVITPHAHSNMVSAHMVLTGALRVRNFDRLATETDALIIRPTKDHVITDGDISTMSAERDNIHWFVPVSERAVTFDIIISGLVPGDEYQIQAIDPLRGEQRKNGTIRAPLLSFKESSQFYNRDM